MHIRSGERLITSSKVEVKEERVWNGKPINKSKLTPPGKRIRKSSDISFSVNSFGWTLAIAFWTLGSKSWIPKETRVIPLDA